MTTQLDLSKNFFTLSPSEVQLVLDMAKAAKYRKPKSANGSTARYYFARLQRQQGKEKVEIWTTNERTIKKSHSR